MEIFSDLIKKIRKTHDEVYIISENDLFSAEECKMDTLKNIKVGENYIRHTSEGESSTIYIVREKFFDNHNNLVLKCDKKQILK